MNYSFIVYGHPYVKKSNQRLVWNGRRSVRIDTPRYKEWHKSALQQLKLDKRPSEPIDEPVNLQCKFYVRTNGRVDLSALYEGIQDVLVEIGILADDNSKIVCSHDGSGVFLDRENPRLEVTITPKGESYER